MEKIVEKITEEKKIRFSNLSGWLKTIVVIDWVIATLYLISFLIGFISVQI